MEARKGDLTISLNQVVVVLAIKSQLRRMTKTPVRLRTHSRQQRGFITTSIAAWVGDKEAPRHSCRVARLVPKPSFCESLAVRGGGSPPNSPLAVDMDKRPELGS